MIVSVHQPQYLPWLGYFHKIDKSDCFVFLDSVQYKPREFQNRNRIRTKDGWIWLTVPVQVKGHYRQPIADVLIDNSQDWASDHRRSLQVWYAKAPFFKEHFPFFEDLYGRRWERLMELNISVIRYCLAALGMTTRVEFESELGTTEHSTARIIQLCKKLGASTYLSGTGGKDYLDEAQLTAAGIQLAYQRFEHPRYGQQFVDSRHPFEPFMSVVDLLFNEGPASGTILRSAS